MVNKVTPVSLGYLLSVFNKNSTIKQHPGRYKKVKEEDSNDLRRRRLELLEKTGANYMGQQQT